MGRGCVIIVGMTSLFYFFIVLFKYLIWVKFTQNILREILDISLDYWLLRYEYLSDMGGFSLGWNINKSAFGLSIEFRGDYAPSTISLVKIPHCTAVFLSFLWQFHLKTNMYINIFSLKSTHTISKTSQLHPKLCAEKEYESLLALVPGQKKKTRWKCPKYFVCKL